MATYQGQVQYPQMQTAYQPIPDSQHHIVPISCVNDDSGKHKNFDVNFRVHWGPDVSFDLEGLGISRDQEIARTSALNGLINPETFLEHSYSSPFFFAIKTNNAVYKVTYQVVFTFLAFVVGFFLSFAMAIALATTEFLNQFAFRPVFRMTKIYAGFAIFASQVAYEICRPAMALFLPWNKQ